MNVFLLVVNALFALAIIVKIQWVTQHIRWIGKNGPAYKLKLEALRAQLLAARALPPSPGVKVNADVLDIYNLHRSFEDPVTGKNGGHRVAAFGLKEFRARRHIFLNQSSGSLLARLEVVTLRALVFLWDFGPQAFFSGVLIVGTGQLVQRGNFEVWVKNATFGVCLLMMVTIILLTVEATVNYARLGNYATAFQDPLKYVNDATYSKFTTEVVFLLTLGLVTMWIDSATVNFAASAGVDFGVANLGGLSNIFSDIYHATMAFIFSTQMMPDGVLGQLIVLLINAQGVGLFILTLAAFGSAIQGGESA